MKHSSFFWFILPTATAMLLFIALPIVSVLVQSVHTPHDAVLIETENCGPFGCTTATTIDQEATRALRDEKPLGKFVGLDIYFDRGHLAIDEVAETWANAESLGGFFADLNNLPFYRAMAFTLTFTFTVTPLMLVFGLMIALGVNALHQKLRGVLIFFFAAHDRLTFDRLAGIILDDRQPRHHRICPAVAVC